MADFHDTLAQHQTLSEEAQKKAGQATGTTMDKKHVKFLEELIGMIDRKEVDASNVSSMFKEENYSTLDETARDAVDLAALNLADQLRLIESYFRSTQTPNASPQLQTMIEHFWNMKSRLEDKYGDVLKF